MLATHVTFGNQVIVDSRTITEVSQEGMSTSVARTFFPFSWVWFSIVALATSLLAAHRMVEGDIWVHLRNAQELCARHTLIHHDLYTFTSAGAPLINFEWLSELPFFLAFQAWSFRGLLAVEVLLLWLTFGCAYYLALRRGADCADAALVTIAGVLLGSYSLGPRMFHFGYLCLMAVIFVLERFTRTASGLWLLPPIFTIWINLHASWVFGFVVLGLYVGTGLFDGRWNNIVAERWSSPDLRKLLLATVGSVAALFINPYGYRLVRYPFELLGKQRAVRDELTEWQSVDFHTFWGKLAMVMLVALLAAAWFSEKPWPLRDVLLAAFAVWAGLTHIRFLLFAGIVLVPILAPRLRLLAPPDDNAKPRPWLNLAVTAIMAGLIVWAYPTNARMQESNDSQFPRDGLRFLQQNHISGRLFHYYAFGGYIEWYAPEIKTFADPRTDIFIYNGVLADYLNIVGIDHTFELLDKYKIDYVLFPVDMRLTYALDHNPGWRAIYVDGVVKIFERVPGTKS